MLNAVDGSEDHLIKIPGVEEYVVADASDCDEDGDESEEQEGDEFDANDDSPLRILILQNQKPKNSEREQ
jgi:hypothetical protein